MIRLPLVFLCAVALACGDDDGMPPMDGGTDVGPSDCIYVESGASGGNGTEAMPFGTLEDALGASGDRVCVGVGAFALPDSFDRAVNIEGAGAGQTLLSGSLGCASVSILDAFDDAVREDAPVAVNVAARLTIRDVTVEGCAVGVYARDVIVELENIEFQDVQASVVLEGSAQATLRGSTLRTGAVATAPAALQRAAVVATPGSTLRTESDTTIMGSGGNYGVLSRGGTLVMTSTLVLAGNAGVWVEDAVAATLGPDLELRGQTDDGAFFGHNRVRGGVASLDGVLFQGPSVAGLIVDNDASVDVARTDFAAIAGFGLVAASGDVTLRDAVSIELLGEGTGVFVDTGNVTLAGALRSETTSTMATHAYVREGTLTSTDGTYQLSGGALGVLVAEAGACGLAGTIEASDVETAFSVRGSELTLGDVSIANVGVGVAALSGGVVTVSDAMLQNVEVGVFAHDASRFALTNTNVENASVRGVVLSGDAHATASTATELVVDGSDNVGFQISGPHAVSVTGGRFEGAGRGGIEASVGANVDVDGSEFRANERMGIAFYDAEGSVMGARFGGTLLQGGRADEIRITANEGTTREVEIGSLNFDLDVARDCSGGGCVLMLANGGDAIGIVTPNCIVESAGEALTSTTLEENGGTFNLVGPSAWASVLAGRNFDLGLSSGSATPPPAAPTPDDPVAPPPSPI